MLYISFVSDRTLHSSFVKEDVWYSVGSLTTMKHAERNSCEPTYECHFPIRSRSVEEGKKLWAFLL